MKRGTRRVPLYHVNMMIFYDLKLKRIDGRVHCWNVQIMVLLDKGKSRYCAYILMEANVNDGWPHISFAGLVWLGITDVSPRAWTEVNF